MKKLVFIVAILLLAFASYSLEAQLSTAPIGSGSAMYTNCRTAISQFNAPPTDQISRLTSFNTGLCMGFVRAVWAMLSDEKYVCGNPSAEAMIRSYTGYMDKKPKMFDEPEMHGVAAALMESYVCPVATSPPNR